MILGRLGLDHATGLDATRARANPRSLTTDNGVHTLDVGGTHATGMAIRMADGVSGNRPLTTDFTYSGHLVTSNLCVGRHASTGSTYSGSTSYSWSIDCLSNPARATHKADASVPFSDAC